MAGDIKLFEMQSAKKFIEANWPNDPLLRKLIKTLVAEYEQAVKQDHIRNPVAYALYRVWKIADRGGKI